MQLNKSVVLIVPALFVFVVVSLINIGLFSSSSYAHSTAYEPDRATSVMLGFKKDVELILSGERLRKEGREILLCSMVRGQMLRQEQGKVLYNDLFNEIKSPEQTEDIKKWAKEIEILNARLPKSIPSEDCDLAFKLWNDYDNKWYAAERNKKQAQREKQIKDWENLVKNTGPEYLDAVIEGTVFQIPRKYIWFDRNKKDGIPDGVNLLFNYPNLTIEREENTSFGERTEVAGVLKKGGIIKNLPCVGFEEREDCTYWQYQAGFVTQHLNCGKYNPDEPGKRHLAQWRNVCHLRSGFDDVVESVFDEELQMWNLNDWAYYTGDPEFPDYWIQCKRFPKDTDLKEIEQGSCQSAFQVNNKVFFKYGFPRALLWEHQKLHESLKAKINNFIVN